MIVHARTPEQEAGLLAYMAHRLGEEPKALVGDMPFHIMASVRDNRILGAVMFLNFRRQSIEFHLCGSPGWLTRGEIGELFAYPFVYLNCARLWCLIRRNNKPARRGVERLGFRVLGVADDEFGNGKDGILYTMRRADCKWLKRLT
jgi:RimJ/RimL family protein N-acetyltransferase